MSAGRGEQIEKGPLRTRKSHKYAKRLKNQRERRRAKLNPEDVSEYRKYTKYEV